jgi:hypothetical protein
MEYLILRTVDGDDTLSVTEHPCADARALPADTEPARIPRAHTGVDRCSPQDTPKPARLDSMACCTGRLRRHAGA